MPLTLEAVADIVGGQVDDDVVDVVVEGLVYDAALSVDTPWTPLYVHRSRHDVEDRDALDAAARSGHEHVLCAEELAGLAREAGLSVVAVDDVEDALAGLGTWVREQHDPFVIVAQCSRKVSIRLHAALSAAGSTRVGWATSAAHVGMELCTTQGPGELLLIVLGVPRREALADLAYVARPDVLLVGGQLPAPHPTPLQVTPDEVAAAHAVYEPEVVQVPDLLDEQKGHALVGWIATLAGRDPATVQAAWAATSDPEEDAS